MNVLIHPNRHYLFTLCLIGCYLIFADSVKALVFEESLDGMIQRADLIFVGTMVEIKSYRKTKTIKPYGHDKEKTAEVRSTYTDHVFEIDEVLKGNYKEPMISISQMGGFNGGQLGSWSTSYFLLLDNQYVVVAIRKQDSPNEWVSASGGQGVFEKFEKDGLSYLRNVNTDQVTNKDEDQGTKTNSEFSMEGFLQKVKEIAK